MVRAARATTQSASCTECDMQIPRQIALELVICNTLLSQASPSTAAHHVANDIGKRENQSGLIRERCSLRHILFVTWAQECWAMWLRECGEFCGTNERAGNTGHRACVTNALVSVGSVRKRISPSSVGDDPSTDYFRWVKKGDDPTTTTLGKQIWAVREIHLLARVPLRLGPCRGALHELSSKTLECSWVRRQLIVATVGCGSFAGAFVLRH